MINFALISETIWQALIAAVVTIALALINKKVNTVLAIAKDTHTLVNSNMGMQLGISATALAKIADFTKKPKDREIAEKAKQLLEEHNAKQAIVDSGQNG